MLLVVLLKWLLGATEGEGEGVVVDVVSERRRVQGECLLAHHPEGVQWPVN